MREETGVWSDVSLPCVAGCRKQVGMHIQRSESCIISWLKSKGRGRMGMGHKERPEKEILMN